MTLQDVLGLFALVGGTVFVTFQIVWTVTHDKNGNDRHALTKLRSFP